MTTFAWILVTGVGMCVVALVGGLSTLVSEETMRAWIKPMVAFSAGSLIGGAFFHMIPSAAEASGDLVGALAWMLVGFTAFFVLEQALHWHHCHRPATDCRQPLGYLILLGDGLHNFLGGVAIGTAMVMDLRVGLTAWLAAVAHELPQELGDFGVLIHGGWSRRKALTANFLAATPFLAGQLLAYGFAGSVDLAPMVPFAAGNFLYIGASDLVPEVNKHQDLGRDVANLVAFVLGLVLLYGIRLWAHGAGHAH